MIKSIKTRFIQPVPMVVMPYVALFSFMLALMLAPWLLGVAPVEEDHSQHFSHDHSMVHAGIEHPQELMPSLAIVMHKDAKQGWNLQLKLSNFNLTPELVNSGDQPNVGHAHLYINGEKIGRLYSDYFHIGSLTRGDNHIRVTLNSNNHGQWLNNGTAIEADTTLTVER